MITLNMEGLRDPIPILRVKKAIQRDHKEENEFKVIISRDDDTRKDFEFFARQLDLDMAYTVGKDSGTFEIILKRRMQNEHV